MSNPKEQINGIQATAFEAYKASGRIAVLMEDGCSSGDLSRELETAAACLEKSALDMRVLCEMGQTQLTPLGKKPVPVIQEVAGWSETNEYGWLHIQLNTLLPHCRFSSPLWLTDTITRLLNLHERRHGKIPMLEHGILIIDEYSDISSRRVYDEDNKGWKAVSNALKGRIIPDDDQYTLSVCLLSQRSPETQCHIYVLPERDAGDFFFMRADNYPFSR